jgi:uncharacterized protein (TIGR03437 family)
VSVSADPKNPTDSLAGVSVKVKDALAVERVAPVLFTRSGEVGYIVPSGTAPGMARITITSANGSVHTATLRIENVGPRVFLESSWSSEHEFPASVLVRVRAGQQSVSPLVFPIDLGQARDETYICLFGTGFRFRRALDSVKAIIGGVDAPVVYAGPQGEFVGMDQVNLKLPPSLAGRGLVELQIMLDGSLIHGGYLQFK